MNLAYAALLTIATTSSWGLSDLLADITSVFTAFIGMVTLVISTITGNPLLLFCVVAGFATVGITIFGRLVQAAKGV